MALMKPRPATLDDLLALNDEIAGLIRAGLPLELGLRQVSSSAPGGLSKLSARLAERVSIGSSLEQALREEGDHLPSIYVAIVEAGMRAGRLPEALELVSGLGRSLHELHRRAVLALIYPLTVLALGYSLSVVLIWACVPRLMMIYTDLRWTPSWGVRMLNSLGETLPVWALIPPVLLVVLTLLNFGMSSLSRQDSGRQLMAGRLRVFSWLPWMRGILTNFDRAVFAKLMSLLVRQQTPLPESLILASHATGNRRLALAATRIAEQVRGGQTLASSVQSGIEIPAFLRSMLAMGERHNSLEATLLQTSDIYQRRAERQIEFARIMLPVLLTVCIGGGVTAVYAFAVFGPTMELFSHFASPTISP